MEGNITSLIDIYIHSEKPDWRVVRKFNIFFGKIRNIVGIGYGTKYWHIRFC